MISYKINIFAMIINLRKKKKIFFLKIDIIKI